jgi:serine protease Do
MRKLILLSMAAVLLAAYGDASAQIRMYRSGERAWLGISYEPVVQPGRDQRETVVIIEVVDNSPAQRAGIQVGDTLVTINSLRASDELLQSLASSLSVGDTVRIRLRRDGRERDLNVIAASRPADARYYVTVPGFDTDSLRSRFRIMVDSVFVGMDTVFGKRMFIGVGPGQLREFRFQMDSVRKMFKFGDSMFIRFDSLKGPFMLRTFGTDSLYAHFDSLRMRLLKTPRGQIQYGIGPRGGVFFNDSTFTVGGPVGIMSFGLSAIAGAELTRMDPGLAEYFGVSSGILVIRVPNGTPADRAGLMPGDVILRANGAAVENVDALRRAVMLTPRGQTTRLEVMRKRALTTVELGRD